jgi:competence protein ComEC
VRHAVCSVTRVRHAIVAPVVALAAGIVAGVAWCPAPYAAAVGTVIAWACSLVAVCRDARTAMLALVLCGWTLAGVALGSVAERDARAPRLVDAVHRLATDGGVRLVGLLREDAVRTPAGVALVVDVESVESSPRGLDVSGGVRLTVLGELAPRQIAEWAAGRRVRLTARLREPARYFNPGVPDHRLSLARRGIVLVGTVKSAALVDVVELGSTVDEFSFAIRQHVRRTVASLVGRLSSQSAAIVTAVLIGDRAGLDDRLERQMQEAGTFHVIAISGGNIAVFVVCLLAVARALRLTWRVGLAVSAVGLLLYGTIATGGSSVSRAIVCALVYLAALSVDQRSGAPSALAIAALIILSVSPLAVLEAGFLLTFGATIAILIAARRVRFAENRPMLRVAATVVLASLATEFGLLPIAAWFFYRVSFAGLLLNLAAVPLMTIVQIGGLATVGLSALSADIGALAAWVPHLAAEGLVRSAALVEYVRWTTWRTPPPPWWLIGGYYLVLAGWVTRSRWVGRTVPYHRLSAVLITACSLGVAILVVSGPIQATLPGGLRLTVLDVGQGDSTVVQAPNGQTLVIDAGGLGGQTRFDIGERIVAPALWSLGVRRLEGLVVTHGDPDHIGGAPALVEIFRPRRLWEGIPVPRHAPMSHVIRTAVANGVHHHAARAGDEVRVGGVSISVLHPPAPDWERQRVRNDDSIVLDVRYGDVSIILPGDIGADAERSLIPRLRPARTRVLKVAHHGSATSTSAEFVAALRPQIAIVSCGRENRYGHPAPVVLGRLQEAGVAIFRTDQHGAVTLQTDGSRVHVTSVLPHRHENTETENTKS